MQLSCHVTFSEMDESVRTPTKKVSGRKGRLKSVETAESPPSMEEEAAGSSPRQRDVAVSKSVQRLHTKKVTGRDQDEQVSVIYLFSLTHSLTHSLTD